MAHSSGSASVVEYLNTKGIHPTGDLYIDLDKDKLIEDILTHKEGVQAGSGAIVVTTGKNTGRSPYDKYIVSDADHSSIWWSKTTKSMSASQYSQIRGRLIRHLEKRPIYIQHMSACRPQAISMPITVVCETAWHSLFAKNLLLPGKPTGDLEYLILHAPTCFAHPETDHTASPVFIIINLDRKEILIGGTAYAGELKKAVFTMLNYILPTQNILPMHCSATAGKNGDVSLFFGLSGTGKTTLSSDPERLLIGDDEHGWSDQGIFNFEGGCYAKTIRLCQEFEPVIWNAVGQPGSILENVILDQKTGKVNFDDNRLTENTRGAYPLAYVPNYFPSEIADHPNHLFFLSADAFGILPAIAKLTTQQTMEYFLAGYTSKLAGTERGLKPSPTPTFSACFAAPFLPRPPQVYAKQLAERIEQHHTSVWLINTGWFGGPYGVGQRFPLPITRKLIRAVIQGEMDQAAMETEPIFGLSIPKSIPGIPEHYLLPWKSWPKPEQYRESAQKLLAAFKENEKHL